MLNANRVAFIFTDGGIHGKYSNDLGDALAAFVEDGNALIMGCFSNAQKGNQRCINLGFELNLSIKS